MSKSQRGSAPPRLPSALAGIRCQWEVSKSCPKANAVRLPLARPAPLQRVAPSAQHPSEGQSHELKTAARGSTTHRAPQCGTATFVERRIMG